MLVVGTPVIASLVDGPLVVASLVVATGQFLSSVLTRRYWDILATMSQRSSVVAAPARISGNR
jgi:hypothetical protein